LSGTVAVPGEKGRHPIQEEPKKSLEEILQGIQVDEAFKQEVQRYRSEIVEAVERHPDTFWNLDELDFCARFKALAQADRQRCRLLCVHLLTDKEKVVRYGALKLLSSLRIRDTILAQMVIYVVRREKNLREEALGALWVTGTYQVLPWIFLFAERGYERALFLVLRMIRTPEEIERGIAIARKYIDAEEYYLRETALFLLQKYSTMDVEAERVLGAVQKYLDELHIDALKKAPPEIVLEPLKALRAPIGEKYAEYKDLTAVINVLEQKVREQRSASGADGSPE